MNGARYDGIMTLAYGTNESQWVAITLPERRQQMAAYVDWEQSAVRIVEVAPLLVHADTSRIRNSPLGGTISGCALQPTHGATWVVATTNPDPLIRCLVEDKD